MISLWSIGRKALFLQHTIIAPSSLCVLGSDLRLKSFRPPFQSTLGGQATLEVSADV